MGSLKLIWCSLAVVFLSYSTYVEACCDEKGLCLLEALKEMKECKKAVLASLLKPLLECKLDQVKFSRELTSHGISATYSCDVTDLKEAPHHRFQGILYVMDEGDKIFWSKFKKKQFSVWYKWLVVGEKTPSDLERVRYDVDIALLRMNTNTEGLFNQHLDTVHVDDIYVHPIDGASNHPWAVVTKDGFQLTHEWDRILRRQNLKKYPLTMASPVGTYSPDSYGGSFVDYLLDESIPERDSSVRSGYMASSLLIESVNASKVLMATPLWNAHNNNESMLHLVSIDSAQLSGAILQILLDRIKILDYIMPIWPFSVGFTYLAERESSSNMYVEPFSSGVWWSCLITGITLALVQRLTAIMPEEKDGAFIGVLATWLQQDSGAVPKGLSGRWAFIVMSISAMLVHAYYTSAIVSALMSSGRSGPQTLRALGDSKYAIASENYAYMKYLFFEVETKWADLEYLKKKKKTSKLYQKKEKGVKLIQEGGTAYHTEYNQIYPLMNTFTDEQLCKLSYVDTIPEVLTWVVASKRGEWFTLLRPKGAWLHETGLAKRLVSKIKLNAPPCRSAMLAERVNFGDVVPLLCLTSLGAVLSFVILAMEIVFDRAWKRTKWKGSSSVMSLIDVD